MFDFRVAAANNDLVEMERLSKEPDFQIDEPGPKSGKSAAHVAAKRAHFKALYWLYERGANFHLPDLSGKTPLDYLQEKEIIYPGSKMPDQGDRKYFFCNAHCKVWFAHDPNHFMPYLYQQDFRQYREKNPEGAQSLLYSRKLLSDSAFSALEAFAEKYQIALIDFEGEFGKLTDRFGTDEDKAAYRLALEELAAYPEEGGGNLAVVSDLTRWGTVLLRIGSYSDTDVEIGQHKWEGSIEAVKALALNLGSLVYPNMITPWLNGDILAVASLFPKAHLQGRFKVTLPQAACFVLKKVQTALIASCVRKMSERRESQRFLTLTFSDVSLYLKDYFAACRVTSFTPQEIQRIQHSGLDSFSPEERSSIIQRMANLMRRKVAEEFGGVEHARKYSLVFRGVGEKEHEKFLLNYMRALQMSNIKERVKNLSGTYVFSGAVWECIALDDWEKYSIYSHRTVELAFRSTNTVRFDTDPAENDWICKTQKCADLSFTPFGMQDVMRRSSELQEKAH